LVQEPAPSFWDQQEFMKMAKKVIRRETSSPAQDNQLKAAEDVLVDPKAWEMPQPNRGQIVIFYHRATVAENNADIAHVMRVGERSIEVAFRGQGYSEVLHKDDDRLVKNPDLRMDVMVFGISLKKLKT
jgi:xanthine/CO dehydrogenase XdhC/CoxF family maturation factor